MRPHVHDLYAPLSHKEALGDGLRRPPGARTWVDDVDARRLAAYDLLAAYRDNIARYYLPERMWVSDDSGKPPAAKVREYGDPGLLVDQARSLLLGDAQEITVDGDDEENPDPRIRTFEEWLTGWADVERLQLRLLEVEEHAVGDGDGVFVLGWDTERTRPRLRVYDPGFYFPDPNSLGDDEYPSTVHIAWEYRDNDRVWIRRMSWQLVPVDPRRLPWQAPGEPPATRTCLFSDGTWDASRLSPGETVYTLNSGRAVWRVQDEDMGVDFVPVVHIPNDAAGDRHFGRSLLLRVAHVLDDLAGGDTDLAANSELVGSTPLLITGASSNNLPAGPGARWNIPDGDARFLDTSRALDAGLTYVKHLLDRMAVNSRLAAALLGRVSPADVPSGYALELGFATTRSLIREMRAVRNEKYPLVLKFAMRLAQVGGVLPPGPTPVARITLGGYLPADKSAAVDRVTKLLREHAISRITAVRELQAAGLDIDDAQAEVERIRAEAFADAVALVDATGDVTAARDMLGLPTTQPPL